MREILFRGKRIGANRNRDGLETGTMVYGSLFVDHKGQAKIKWYNEEYGSSITSIVEPETVGQYTGLTDKNGKKIFEGDLIASSSDIVWQVGFENGSFVCKDEFNKTYFSFNEHCDYNKETKKFENVIPVVYKVIGNIYDNPELLKGGVQE